MLEQQLVDYIKKAREAGQTDDQTRNLLYKNGWTVAEVDAAIASLSQPQAQPQVQPIIRPEPQINPKPQPQPQTIARPIGRSSNAVIKLLIILIIVAVLAGAGYFIYLNLMPQDMPIIESPVAVPEQTESEQPAESEQPIQPEISPEVQIIKSDISQIDLIAQTVFSLNESYSSLCNHNLLNGYLAEYGKKLIELNNDIVDQGAKKPVCFGGPQGYCVSTQLADESYLCVDERGILGTTKCVSSATVCE